MKKKIFVLMVALIVIIGVASSSYAYLKAENESDNNVNLALSNFGVILLTDMTSIQMDNSYPMLDTEGLKNDSTTFQIQNTGELVANYKVSLIDSEVASTMSNSDVRYQLKKTSSVTGETETLDIANLSGSGLINEGTIEVNEIITYEIVMWIDYDANPNNLSFSKVVLVEGMQSSNLDQSGANYPELLDNMIPVYYDKTSDTEGVWRVADSRNLNEDYKWFDYNDYMWANAVTVNKDVMDSYKGYSGPKKTTENVSVNIETYEEKVTTYNLNEITFKNTNQSKHSTSSILKLTFTTTSDGTLSFNYTVGSEKSYDKLTITINNGSTTTTLVNAVSGSVSSTPVSTSLTANTSYTLTATYSKDGSGDQNGDTTTITNLAITSTLDGEVTKDETVSNPWSGVIKEVVPEKKQIAATSYTYDETTGVFTLSNDYASVIYTNSHVGYFTCNSDTKTTCYKLYEIKGVTDGVVTSVNVHEGSIQGKIGSTLGQEVKMEDITTMWVWIPRYKYTIFNGNNENVSEQLIQVAFEHGTSRTGTVTCTDNITTSSSSSSSQTCTDETNGSIVNGKSTYTHPAFTFGDEELTGFWMAKFEMSTDDTITGCTSSSVTSSCNVADINVLVKPDVLSLRYQTASNQFAAIRKMEVYDNIHGFTQSDSATSYLDENGYLTGDIKNDNNNYDIHMLKNLEWGAVTYLSQSVYGKWSNSLYSGDYRRVYKNNYYTSTNYVYKTGYSGATYNTSASTSTTYLYNDMTSAGTGQGYKGSGASTNGTIYGVFDMNGGAYDLVIGNMINSSWYFYPGSAGTWSTASSGNIPNAKYYDKYSYNSNSNSLASQSRGKLGDATREMTQSFGSTSGGWAGSYRYMPYSSSSGYWFLRGGYASSNSYNLLYLSYYSNAASSNANSTRPVLAIPRDMPWLNE